MAAFLPIKAGGWAFGEVLTSGQMNQLNTDFPFAANLRDGGAYTPSGNLSIQSPSTKGIIVNGLILSAVADGAEGAISGDFTAGGGLHGTAVFSSGPVNGTGGTFTGRIRAPKRIAVGILTAGIHPYAVDTYDKVYCAGAPASGCIWKITTPSDVVVGESIEFENSTSSTLIQIYDPSGAFIESISGATGAACGFTFTWDGTTWQQTGAKFHT